MAANVNGATVFTIGNFRKQAFVHNVFNAFCIKDFDIVIHDK